MASIILHIPATQVKCQRCSWIWNYKGKNRWANCPHCRTYVNIKKQSVALVDQTTNQRQPVQLTQGAVKPHWIT